MEEVRYALSDRVHLAYQVTGDGPIDLVLVPGFISHIDHRWQEPSLARFLRQLGTFARVIGFDRRGLGLSDRDSTDTAPTMVERVQDVVSVMDAAKSRRAALFAWSEGGPTAIRFALEHPERVSALILMGTAARFTWAPDYPHGIPRVILKLALAAGLRKWGTGVALSRYGPSKVGDQRFQAWWAASQRYSATPGAVASCFRMHLDVDVRDDLPQLRTPTLILHRTDDLVLPVGCGRFLGDWIPQARYQELPGSDHIFWLGDQRVTLAAIRSFVLDTGEGVAHRALIVRRRRPSSGWESLTPAELEVVRAVSSGSTIREIAAQLSVSPRTVQSHVASSFIKLGMKSRAEVAAEAARRFLPL